MCKEELRTTPLITPHNIFGAEGDEYVVWCDEWCGEHITHSTILAAQQLMQAGGLLICEANACVASYITHQNTKQMAEREYELAKNEPTSIRVKA